MAILGETLDDIVDVDDHEISEAIVLLVERAKLVVEGAGAASVAAVLAGKAGGSGTVVPVVSGGNIDPTLLIAVMRHGLTLASRYLVIRTRVPDRPGELLKLLDEEPSISVLVLGADSGPKGPGPLVTTLASKYSGKLRVPLTIVPGTLTDVTVTWITNARGAPLAYARDSKGNPLGWTTEPPRYGGSFEQVVVGHQETPGFHFVPAAAALAEPYAARAAHWRLRDPAPRERYAPAYADSFVALPHQAAAFRRGESTLVVSAYDVSADPGFRGRPVEIALVVSPDPHTPPAIHRSTPGNADRRRNNRRNLNRPGVLGKNHEVPVRAARWRSSTTGRHRCS